MGYEKMERRFLCPCGKGFQVCEWEEHDTWVHGNEGGSYRLECEDCAARYDTHWNIGGGQVWILKEDKKRLDDLQSQVPQKQTKLQKIIVERYEESFVKHVLGLRNRTEMKYALHGGGREFFKNAKDNPSYVEKVARESIRARPHESFGELRVSDSEVSGILAEIDSLKKEIDEFKKRMEKIPVPDRWGNVRNMSS